MKPIWQPTKDEIEAANLTAFRRFVQKSWHVECGDYGTLHRWSVARPEQFWASVWDFSGAIGDWDGATVVEGYDRILGAKCFPQARANFARIHPRRRDAHPALVALIEDWSDSEVWCTEPFDKGA